MIIHLEGRTINKKLFSCLFVLVLLCAITPNKAYAIKGADVSSLITQEDFSVVYRESSSSSAQDMLTILANHGIKLARIRLFVDPNTNDTGTAMDLTYVTTLAARCKAKGMKVMLAIHYSDTWADPDTQTKPTAWSSLTQAQLVTQIYDYTYSVCSTIQPDYVQIGNEITCGMLWPNGEVCSNGNWANLRALINSAYNAVKDVNSATITVVHVSETSAANLKWFFDDLTASSVSFDMIGISYYPEYHGTISNLSALVTQASTYGKGVMLCEIGEYYTDGSTSTYSEATQAAFVTNVLAVDSNVIYWEPGWMWDSSVGYRCLFKPISSNWQNVEPTSALSRFDDDTNAPSAPTGLTATASDSTVALDWSDNSESDMNGYNVYRSTTSGGTYTRLNSTILTSSNYTDNSVTNGTTYYYVVTAVDTSSNESDNSSEVSATPQLITDVNILGSWTAGTTHAKETGTNRALVLTVHAEGSTSGSVPALTSATYGGQTMTKVVEVANSSGSTRTYTAAFILNDTGITAATTTTFTPTWSTSPTSVAYGSVFLKNVNQSTLTGTSASNTTSTGGTITTSALTTTDGDMVIDAATCSTTGTYTVNNSFTKALELTVTNADGVDGYKAATGASETPSATHSNTTNRQSLIGFVVKSTGGVSAPGKATSPSPSTGATSVGITTDLSWTADSNATSHDVYFGTTSPGTSQGEQTGTTFDTGTMANGTTYYWRIDEKNAGGTTTGDVWSFTTIVAAPGQATSPSPSTGATDVSISTTLSWTAGTNATSHNVYFGTSSSPSLVSSGQTTTTYSPGTLTNGTTYYWRIDEINAGGTTTGTVWSFTTIVAAPGQATSPSPSTGATDVSISTTLSWTAGTNATSHNVYFGTSNSPSLVSSGQTTTTYSPGTLTNSTTYYWRVDEINAGGTTTGTVWSFTTIVAAPGQATSPSPSTGATSVSITPTLSWTAGTNATSHLVYFGTTSPGTYQGEQAGTTYDTGTMASITTYYWRVDEKNAGGTTTGTVWSFTTQDIEAPTPNPIVWAIEPNAISSSSITMTATTATDISGVEYYFANTTDPNHDSNWVSSPVWTDTGLVNNTTYTYQVKARDMSINLNETGWSDTVNATTFIYDCTNQITSDLDGDCEVDFFDYAQLVNAWAGNLSDIAQFAIDWLTCNRDPASECWQ